MGKKKKKVNPYNQPIDNASIDFQAILEESTTDNVFRGWLLFLGAMADFYSTTSELLVRIWDAVNAYSSTFNGKKKNLDKELDIVNEFLGEKSLPEIPAPSSVKTVGGLIKFKRRIYRRSLYAAFSLITYPLLQNKMLDEDVLRGAIKKAYSLGDEVVSGELSYEDIQMVLVDEYHLLLSKDEKGAYLRGVDEDFVFDYAKKDG